MHVPDHSAPCDAALWRYAKEQLLDKGEIGEVQWVFARLQGNRAMMFRWGPTTPPLIEHTRPRPAAFSHRLLLWWLQERDACD